MNKIHIDAGYIIAMLIVVATIGYFAGVSTGKAEAPSQEHTDSEYVAAKACYDYLSNQMEHISTITTYLGSEPTYEALAAAVNEITTYDEGIAVLSPSDGGYICP